MRIDATTVIAALVLVGFVVLVLVIDAASPGFWQQISDCGGQQCFPGQ